MEVNRNTKRAMFKSELAALYNPDADPSTAGRILRRWISQDAELLNALYKKNYSKNSHLLTLVQVEIIYEYLGKP